MLKDRDKEYGEMVEQQGCERYLGVNGMEHAKTKARHPQANGICERFYKMILQEFHHVAFRHKLHHSLEELQAG